MKICVIGAGHGGTALAADLALAGHEVALVKSSTAMHGQHFEYLRRHRTVALIENGVERIAELSLATTSLSDAAPGSDIVVVFVQTNYQAEVISRLAPYLDAAQLVLFEPGYLATAMLQSVVRTSQLPMTAEATSSPLDCRIVEPGVVSVSFRNPANHVAVWPAARASEAHSLLAGMGVPWLKLDSIVEAALHNPNLIVHTIGAIMSIPRIEVARGDYWMYREVFTPSVWNMVESLDGEKMAVLESFGWPRLSYVDACKARNAPDDARSATEVFFDYAHNHSVSGPSVVDSRYITEDVSEGLVMLEDLGRFSGVPTPVASALIDLAGAALGRDFRMTGRTLERLGSGVFSMLSSATAN